MDDLPVCCLLGPEGTGKTTLLEDLEEDFRAFSIAPVWIRLNRDSTREQRRAAIRLFATSPPGTLLFLDGGEILNRFQWWRVKRHARERRLRLIATVHQSRRLPVLHQTAPNWSLAREIITEVGGPALEPVAKSAFDASDGNMRCVFRACYLALSVQRIPAPTLSD